MRRRHNTCKKKLLHIHAYFYIFFLSLSMHICMKNCIFFFLNTKLKVPLKVKIAKLPRMNRINSNITFRTKYIIMFSKSRPLCSSHLFTVMVQFRITQVFVAKLYVVTIKIVNVAVKFYETKSMLLVWYFQINNGVKRIKYYKVVQTVSVVK